MGIWSTYEQATASIVDDEIEFNGKLWKPNRKLAYVHAKACHTLPVVNSKRRAFTVHTIANSYETMAMQQINFEHRLKFYGHVKDKICGAVAAVKFPPREEAIERAEAGEAVPLEILFGLWRKAEGVDAALVEMASDENPWKVSMETEFPPECAALYDGEKFYPVSELSSEMRDIIKPSTVEPLGGVPFSLVMGGQDGKVLFTGTAMTKWAADQSAEILQAAANDEPEDTDRIVVNCGWETEEHQQEAASMFVQDTAAQAWKTKDAPDSLFAFVPAEAKGKEGNKSLRKFPLASVEKKGLDPAILRNALARLPQSNLSTSEKASTRKKIMGAISRWNSANAEDKITVSEKGFKTIGETAEAEDGHAHEVTADLHILPANGHEHWPGSMSFDPDKGVIEGFTNTHRVWRDGRDAEVHLHKIRLGGSKRKQSRASIEVPELKEESKMFGDLAKFLREQATALRDENPDNAKAMDEMASKLEEGKGKEDAEAVVSARIESGDLIPKVKHEEAVAAAKEEARTSILKDNEEKAAEETRVSEVRAARTKVIEEAKLDPKFVLGPDRTIESAVAAIPATEDGDKDFDQQVGEWKMWSEKTKQAIASKKPDEVTDETGSAVPVGGAGGSDKKEKPAHAFF